MNQQHSADAPGAVATALPPRTTPRHARPRPLGSLSAIRRGKTALFVALVTAGCFLSTIVLTARDLGGYRVQMMAKSSDEVHATRSGYHDIVFTNLQWYQPSESTKPTIARSLVARDVADSVEAHPRYNATLWSYLHEHPDPSRPILAFLDYDLCRTVHWPGFGSNRANASDTENGRPAMPSGRYLNFKDVGGIKIKDECQLIEMALASPAMASPESRLVVISCAWAEGRIRGCLGPERNSTLYRKLVVGHVSGQSTQVNPQDFGVAPWPVKTVDGLPREKVCNDSLPYLISFRGRGRKHFPEFHKYFRPLSEERADVYADFGVKHYKESSVKGVLRQVPKEEQANDAYYELMRRSTFCPVARGDNLYSVRFSEVLSSGCIPIIYADGYVLPYTRSIVDWHKMAIIIPQQNANHTLAYIEHMTKEEICERRLMAYDFFHNYVVSGEARLRAIVEIMDERLRTGRIEPFQYAPGISSHPASRATYVPRE